MVILSPSDFMLYACVSIFVFPFLRAFAKDVLNRFDGTLLGNRFTDDEEESIVDRAFKWIKEHIIK